MSVSYRDVRRVGHDQIELLRSERTEPVAENKVDFSPVFVRVPPREGEGRFGSVRGDDREPRAFARERLCSYCASVSAALHSRLVCTLCWYTMMTNRHASSPKATRFDQK